MDDANQCQNCRTQFKVLTILVSRLRRLSLAHNPIRSLTNESFLSLERLEHLDIAHMDISSINVR